MERIIKIQHELKCAKNQKNTFGNYKYRSCEDILEAVKPLLNENKLCLMLNDEIINIGERYYVKATAIIYDSNGTILAENSAYAREQSEKKGLDESQITGTASSYARKYALNGLFAIDDTKDADTDEYAKQTKSGKNYRKEVIDYCKNNNIDMNEIAKEYGLTGKSSQDDFYDVYIDLTEGEKNAKNS